MIMRTIILTVLLASCATTRTTQSDVDAAVRKCGLDGQLVAQVAGRDLTIARLNPNVEYQRFDCLLAEVKRMRLNLGIVGNEAPDSR